MFYSPGDESAFLLPLLANAKLPLRLQTRERPPEVAGRCSTPSHAGRRHRVRSQLRARPDHKQ